MKELRASGMAFDRITAALNGMPFRRAHLESGGTVLGRRPCFEKNAEK
jgi:hypothetical protein